MGEVFIGQGRGTAQGQAATMVFDTGSNWLTVKSTLCKKTCVRMAYCPVDSKTAKQVSLVEKELRYGSADLWGYTYEDTVCLGGNLGEDGSTCMPEFRFMAVSKNVGGHLQPQIDGILGLGANKDAGPSLLLTLRSGGFINQTLISFNLGYNHKSDSSMIFGGYDEQ